MGFAVETFNKFNEQYEIHINKGKLNRLKIFIDMILSFIFIGSTVTDYFSYEFYRLNCTTRREYVVFRSANRLFDFFNDSEYEKKLMDKDEINVIFKDYIKRDWKSIDDLSYPDFVKFLEEKKRCVIKPLDGSCGIGVEFLSSDDMPSEEEFNGMKNKKLIIEEYLIQHEEMAKLNRSSTNTLRVTTVRTDDRVNIMFASMRIGRSGMEVDNYSSGGLAAPIDIETGIVMAQADDLDGNVYTVHPDSNEKIVGFRVPYWEKIISLVKELAMVAPSVRYTGWDIVILDDGPALIEANARGMFIGQQCQTRKGIKAEYERLVEEIKASRSK